VVSHSGIPCSCWEVSYCSRPPCEVRPRVAFRIRDDGLRLEGDLLRPVSFPRCSSGSPRSAESTRSRGRAAAQVAAYGDWAPRLPAGLVPFANGEKALLYLSRTGTRAVYIPTTAG